MKSRPTPTPQVVHGLPPLDMSGWQLSRLDFWPTWPVYAPGVLEECIDATRAGIPDFHFGCLDFRFRSLEPLAPGEDQVNVAINGASSEPLHICERHIRLAQYRPLFRIGHQNRRREHRAYRP